ncbi:MAG: hypothetical protein IPL01_19770 [Acidobacteria bacterium]|nr:hypothetical protein [Acidobacteriota bacterium]
MRHPSPLPLPGLWRSLSARRPYSNIFNRPGRLPSAASISPASAWALAISCASAFLSASSIAPAVSFAASISPASAWALAISLSAWPYSNHLQSPRLSLRRFEGAHCGILLTLPLPGLLASLSASAFLQSSSIAPAVSFAAFDLAFADLYQRVGLPSASSIAPAVSFAASISPASAWALVIS